MLTIPSDLDLQWFLPQLRSLAMPRRMSWREHISAGLILLSQKIVGFADEESFARVARAVRRSETDVGDGRMQRGQAAVSSGFDFFIGKTSGAIAKGSTTGTVTIWDSATDATAIAATTATLTSVYNPFAAVANAKFVIVIQLPFTYALIAAEC